MPRELIFVSCEPTPKLNQELLDRMRARAHEQRLRETYNKTRGQCCMCGTHISTAYNEPLGRYFVMDRQGRFYCTHCDNHFDDCDEEIYVPEEDM